MSNFQLYVCDTETTGVDFISNEPIEISVIRLSTDEQKTWYLKPININTISADALRVNGHKLEDITWKTVSGKEKYKEANEVLVEIENWMSEDFSSSEDKILVGHNVNFDKNMLETLWKKCDSAETFPFNKKYAIDTFLWEFFMDYCKDKTGEYYNLSSVLKKYGIKNEQAHTAVADTKATAELFKKQVEAFKKIAR